MTKEKFIQPIVNEEFYAWVAPDGEIQLGQIAPDEISLLALSKLWHKKGISQSPHEMRLNGFTIEKVTITITPQPS